MGRPQLLPEIFEIVLRPIWWVAGKEQQSPPSSAAEGQRLTEAISVAQVVLLYLLAPHIPYFPILLKSYFSWTALQFASSQPLLSCTAAVLREGPGHHCAYLFLLYLSECWMTYFTNASKSYFDCPSPPKSSIFFKYLQKRQNVVR